jgi:hypothetical protein
MLSGPEVGQGEQDEQEGELLDSLTVEDPEVADGREREGEQDGIHQTE